MADEATQARIVEIQNRLAELDAEEQKKARIAEIQKRLSEMNVPQEKDIEDKAMEALGTVAQKLEPIQKPLGYLGGLSREALTKTVVEPIVGKEIGTREQALAGEYPQFSEVLKEAGVGPGYSLSDILPAMYSETGKGIKLQKGGLFDPTARGVAGGILDVVTDPLSYIGPGIIKKGAQLLQRTTPKYSLISKLSRIPREAIETYAENPELVAGINPEVASKMAEDVVAQSRPLVLKARKEAGIALSTAAREAGVNEVDATSLKKLLNQVKEKAVSNARNLAGEETAKEVENNINSIVKRTVNVPEQLEMTSEGILVKKPAEKRIVDIPDKISPEELLNIKHQLKEIGDLYGGRQGILSKLAKEKAPLQDKEFTINLTNAVEKADEIIDAATKDASKEARARYHNLRSKADNIDTYFSNTERATRTLSNLSSPSYGTARRYIKEADKTFGTNLEQTGKQLEAAKFFHEPSFEAISAKRGTGTSGTLSGMGLGGGVGYLLGGAPGAVAGAAVGSKAFSPWSVAHLQLPIAQGLSPLTAPIGAVVTKGGQLLENVAESQLGKIPPQVWLKMMQEKQKQGEQEQ